MYRIYQLMANLTHPSNITTEYRIKGLKGEGVPLFLKKVCLSDSRCNFFPIRPSLSELRFSGENKTAIFILGRRPFSSALKPLGVIWQ